MPTVRPDERFAVPTLPPHHVPRPRLLARLDEAAPAAATVVSAGAGAGKSVLLMDWARRRDTPVAWLALTPEDDDPARFWRLFLEAVRALGEELPPVAWAPGRTAELLDAALGHTAAPRARLELVLDDAHVLTDPQILAGLDRIVRRWSGRVRLLMTRREPVGLPLHRYRVAGDLAEIGAAELAMTEPETAALLAAHHVAVSGAELTTLVTRTEGWPAGLRLAALWLQGGGPRPAFPGLPAAGTGRITEYLTEEVLAALPAVVRRVLVETSFLDVVPGPLADAVTLVPGCGPLLAEQAEVNSMIIAVDAGSTVFRYHHLLREVLRRHDEGGPVAGRRERHLRAAAWYRRRGDFSRALQCTLAGEDLDQARALVLRGGLVEAFVAQHELSAPARTAVAASTFAGPADSAPGARGGGVEDQVGRWAIAALTVTPGDAAGAVAALPVPDLAGAGVQLVLTQHVAELLLARKAGDAELLDRAVAAIRSAAGRDGSDGPDGPDGRAADLAATARPPAGLTAAALLAQGRSWFAVGRLGDVPPLLDQAVAEADRDGAAAVLLDVLATRAFVAMTTGRWGLGTDSVRRAEAVLADRPDLTRPVILDLAVVRAAELRADWGPMGRALGRALAAGPLYADRGIASTVALLHGIYLACCERFEEARDYLETTPMLRQPGLGPVALFRDRELGEIEIRLGRPERGLELLTRHDDNPVRAVAAAVVARTHLALGDVGRARARIDEAASAPGPPVDRRVRVELLLADALVSIAEDREDRAVGLVRQALDLAGGEVVVPFARWRPDFAGFLARHPGVRHDWPAPPAPTASPAAPVPAPAGGTPDGPAGRPVDGPVDIVAELARLARLHTGGLISDGEFAARKAEVLQHG